MTTQADPGTPDTPVAQTRFALILHLREAQAGDTWEVSCPRYSKPDLTGRGPSRERACDDLMAHLLREMADEREQDLRDGVAAGGDLERFLMAKGMARMPVQDAGVVEYAEKIRGLPALVVAWSLPIRVLVDADWTREKRIQDHVVGAESVFPAGLSEKGRDAVPLLTPALYRALAGMYEAQSFPPDVVKYVNTHTGNMSASDIKHPWERQGFAQQVPS